MRSSAKRKIGSRAAHGSVLRRMRLFEDGQGGEGPGAG